MSEPQSTDAQLRDSLIAETARIPWKDLQRYFAAGQTLSVDASLDLIDVACCFHRDDARQVEQWLQQQLVQPVSIDEAKRWHRFDQVLWAVVIRPWVLLQEDKDANNTQPADGND